jgi:hypothetical protein
MANKLTAKQRKWLEYMALKLELHHDNGTRFDLGLWITDTAREDDWCGTKGCACGLATLDPTFTNAGFPKYLNWVEVHKFFKISYKQAEWLFSAESYKGETYGDKAARKVARRIREFIASNGKVPNNFKSRIHVHI